MDFLRKKKEKDINLLTRYRNSKLNTKGNSSKDMAEE